MNVAFLGLGIMGSRQAANLARAGYALTVWNRTREKADAFAAEHETATAAATVAEAVADSDVVITMVVDGPQVRALVEEAAPAARPDTLFVDMSTIAPSDSRAIANALQSQGMRFVDAPVTGSAPKAQDGTLTIMCGGAPEDVDRARPLLEVMGETIVRVGPVGHGELAKVINNAVAAVNAATVAQALIAGAATGVDLDALTEVLQAGSGNSTMLALKGPPMRAHDFTPLFKLEHMLKDVRLCLEETEAAGVPFPFAALARDLYAAGLSRDLGEVDFSAILTVLEDLAATRIT